jgi:hypothetical protein
MTPRPVGHRPDNLPAHLADAYARARRWYLRRRYPATWYFRDPAEVRALADAFRTGLARGEDDTRRWLETNPAAAGRLDRLMAEIEAHRHQRSP